MSENLIETRNGAIPRNNFSIVYIVPFGHKNKDDKKLVLVASMNENAIGGLIENPSKILIPNPSNFFS